MPFPPRFPPAASGGPAPAPPGSLIVAKDGDILMRRSLAVRPLGPGERDRGRQGAGGLPARQRSRRPGERRVARRPGHMTTFRVRTGEEGWRPGRSR